MQSSIFLLARDDFSLGTSILDSHRSAGLSQCSLGLFQVPSHHETILGVWRLVLLNTTLGLVPSLLELLKMRPFHVCCNSEADRVSQGGPKHLQCYLSTIELDIRLQNLHAGIWSPRLRSRDNVCMPFNPSSIRRCIKLDTT